MAALKTAFARLTSGLRKTFVTVYAAADITHPLGQFAQAVVMIDDETGTVSLRNSITGVELDPSGLTFATKGRANRSRATIARKGNRSSRGGTLFAGSAMAFTYPDKTTGGRRTATTWGSLADAMQVLIDADTGADYKAFDGTIETAAQRAADAVAIRAWLNSFDAS